MKPLHVFPIALLAAGCAASSDKYPSLALRPIESRSDAEPMAPTPVATPDAALDTQVAAIAATLAKTGSDFSAVAARADTAARSRGALATGSDQWLAAQSALAELDGLRGDTQGILSDVERLVTDRADAGQPPFPALDALRDTAQDQVDAAIAKVAAIKALLGEK